VGSGAAQQLSASCRSLRLPRRSPEKRTLGEIVRKAASGTNLSFRWPLPTTASVKTGHFPLGQSAVSYWQIWPLDEAPALGRELKLALNEKRTCIF